MESKDRLSQCIYGPIYPIWLSQYFVFLRWRKLWANPPQIDFSFLQFTITQQLLGVLLGLLLCTVPTAITSLFLRDWSLPSGLYTDHNVNLAKTHIKKRHILTFDCLCCLGYRWKTLYSLQKRVGHCCYPVKHDYTSYCLMKCWFSLVDFSL